MITDNKRILPSLLILFALLCSANSQAEVKHIDNNTLQQLLAEGVPLVDVRTPEEWRMTGVIEGSHRLMFFDQNGNFDAETWLAELNKIAGPEERVIFICASGGRTQPITNFLDQKVGYSKVYNVSKGIREWINNGNPTVPVAQQ